MADADGMVDSFAEFYPEAKERFTCSLVTRKMGKMGRYWESRHLGVHLGWKNGYN